MKIVLLSAGMGTRMLPLTENTPKPLLDIGNGKTILETQIEAIQKSGNIDEIIIVVGYLSEQIEAKLKKYQEMKIKIVHNPFYDISNTLHSLWVVLREIDSDFILSNGDNLFTAQLLNRLINEKEEEDICILVDKTKKNLEKLDTKVTFYNDKVSQISKQIEYLLDGAESVGIMRFQREGLNLLKNMVNSMVKLPENRQEYHLEAINQLAKKYNNVGYLEVSSSDWTEVDVHADLDAIKNKMQEKTSHFRTNFFPEN